MQATNTVDPVEIAKFEAMAAEWWDLEGKFKPLHMMNPVRLGLYHPSDRRRIRSRLEPPSAV